MDVKGLFELEGRVALVTGSTQGIGRAIAEAFVHHGARVTVSGRDTASCELAAKEITAGFGGSGGRAVGIACDIRDAESQRQLVAKTREALGPVDILVANAAINLQAGSLLDTRAEDFDGTFAGNVTSVLQLCQETIPDMQAAGGGSIILVSSVGGLRGNSMLGAYAVSKSAIIQLARNIAVEFGAQGIRANAIVPGLVKTEFAGPLWQNEALAAARIERTPLNRLGEPEDLAGAAVYLASRAGAWTTAQTIVVDGGFVMHGR